MAGPFLESEKECFANLEHCFKVQLIIGFEKTNNLFVIFKKEKIPWIYH